MKRWLMNYATPFIAGLFLVSLVSGVALFFHIQAGWFHSMHEWLSMVLIIPFALHMWRNWKPFVNYFKRNAMVQALSLSFLAAVLFAVWPASNDGRSGPPQFAVAQQVVTQSPNHVAPLFNMSAEDLVTKLKMNGFSEATVTLPLNQIAAKSGKTLADVYSILLQSQVKSAG